MHHVECSQLTEFTVGQSNKTGVLEMRIESGLRRNVFVNVSRVKSQSKRDEVVRWG